jgi:UDP-glucose 4-epimerase
MLGALEERTLLVTGATGFIGRHLVERLLRVPEVRLVVLSRRSGGSVAEDRCIRVVSDCQQLTPEVWRSRGVAAIDYVFHLAAETPKVAGGAVLEDAYEGNVKATAALLESLPSVPRRFILASTLDVYAPLGPEEMLSENTPVKPQGAYGISKVCCETLASAIAAARGFPCVILRYGHIYGPGEQAYRKLIPEAIRRLLRGEPPVVYGDGSAERDYLYVGDAVEATVRAAVVEPAPVGPVNIVRGTSCPIRQVVETMVQVTEYPGAVQYLTDRPGGASLRFDNRKMRTVLGEWPLVSLADGLRWEVADFAACGS